MTPDAAVAECARLFADQPEWLREPGIPIVLAHLLGQQTPRPVPVPEARPIVTDAGVAAYLVSVGANSHPQRAVAVAWWWEQVRGVPDIGTEELSALYREARLTKPRNWPDVLAVAMRRGLLVDAGWRDSRKRWALSAAGRRSIEEGRG